MGRGPIPVEVGMQISMLLVESIKGDTVTCTCSCGKFPILRSISTLRATIRGPLGVSCCKQCMRVIKSKKFSPHATRPPGFKLPPKE